MAKKKEPTFEEVIRACVANGELNHLSVDAVSGPTQSSVLWKATYTPASKFSHGWATHADPIEAMRLAILDDRQVELVKALRTRLQAAAKAGNKDAAAALGNDYVDDEDFA